MSEKHHIEKFMGTNFALFSPKFRGVCAAQKLGEIFDDEPPANEEAALARAALDRRAKGLLVNLVTDTYTLIVDSAETTAEALAELERIFISNSTACVDMLTTQLNRLELGHDERVENLLARSSLLASQLAAAGNPVPDAELARKVLRALPDSYDNFRETLIYSGNPLTLVGIKQLLLNKEQTVLADTPRRPKALYSTGLASLRPAIHNNVNRFAVTQLARPRGGNTTNNNASRRSNRILKTCDYCYMPGHHAVDCRKRQQEQAAMGAGAARGGGGAQGRSSNSGGGGARFSASSRPPPRFALSAIALSAAPACDSPPSAPTPEYSCPWLTGDSCWIIDSGATQHITGNLSLFSSTPTKTFVYQNNNKVVLADGSFVAIDGYGDVELGPILLRDVAYVPGSAFNLLSLPRAVENGANINFGQGVCTVSADDGTVIAKTGLSADGLYRISMPPMPPLALSAATTGTLPTPLPESPALWHQRLGHLGRDNLARLTTISTGINLPAAAFRDLNTTLCEPCADAKTHRAPFHGAEHAPSAPLEYLSTDLCGPLPKTGTGGAKYVLTVLDGYTGLSVVNVLQDKGQTANTLIGTLEFLEAQLGQRVVTVRSDNGSEFVNNKLRDYYNRKGINHETTVPYSPQQNGAAERLNRTLLERGKAMLFHANLPTTLWVEAIETGNFLRNRSPVAGKTATPWELAFNTKPDLSKLRVFGSHTRALIAAPRDKLAPHTATGILVGYAHKGDAYKVMLDNGKIAIARAAECIVNESRLGFGEHTDAAATDAAATDAAATDAAATETVAMDNAASDDDDNDTIVPPGAPPSPPSTPPYHSDDASPSATPLPPPPPRRNPPRAARGHVDDYWVVTPQPAALITAAVNPAIPTTHDEAVAAPDAADWIIAEQDEINALIANDVFEAMDLPAGEKKLPVKWIYTLKQDADGNIVRHKARVVVKGFFQRPGVDYDESFAPVSKYSSLRALLSTAALHDYELQQIDIKTAFLNGKLEETVYVEPPPGYHEAPGKVWHLKRALYGLRQAPRAWHFTLKRELEGLSFQESDADPSLFLGPDNVFLLTYVDDILIAAPSLAAVERVKESLLSVFDAHDLGDAKLFLGMSIERDRAARTLKLSQPRMTRELIANYNMTDGKTKPTPLGSLKLNKTTGTPLDTKDYTYSALVGSLNYLAVCTRPDISQAVGALSKYMAAPTTAHWLAAKHVLRYLAATTDRGITFGGDTASLVGYCDADYAGDPDSRRSTTGFVFVLHNGAISWASRLQKTVAASTTEAEYMAEAAAVKEALWIKTLLTDLNYSINSVKLYADNQAAIKLMSNPIVSQRSKHIDVSYHFARQHIANGTISLDYMPTANMIADTLTKAVPESKHRTCCSGMGLGK